MNTSNSVLAANHPYLQPPGLNCTGRSSDRIGQMHIHERSLRLPPNSHAWSWSTALRPDVFYCEPILEREGKQSTWGKTLMSGWDRLKLSPHMIPEVGGANVEYNAHLTSQGIQHRDTSIAAFILFVCPPKFCISLVFVFSWYHYKSHEKLETMLMQSLYYGIFQSGLLTLPNRT